MESGKTLAIFARNKLVWIVALTLLAFSISTVSASDFGTTGLITTPSARQMSDGHLAATISSNPVVNIFNITYQATPWLETTFRYSVFNPYARQESSDDLRDRSYEAKVRLVRERSFFPELAIGIRDILGTGVWGGEYLVGTKYIGPAEISVGLGWGRFAERDQFNNPLGVIETVLKTVPAAAIRVVHWGVRFAQAVFFVEMSVFSGEFDIGSLLHGLY